VTASLLALGITTALLTSASAAPGDKEFRAVIATGSTTPASTADVWAGASPRVSITLTNLANPQNLGSADITVPADGIAIDAGSLALTSDQAPFGGSAPVIVGSTIQLRNLSLQPAKSVTLSFDIEAECDPSGDPYTFAAQVKQANDFSGTGNDFLPVGPQPALELNGECSLRFAHQPEDAQRGSDITSDVFLPFSDPDTGDLTDATPVTVELVDGSGSGLVTWWTEPIDLQLNTGPLLTATLSGFTSATPVAGVASFKSIPDPLDPPIGPRLNVSASGYTLKAVSAGVPAASTDVSTPFTIVDVGERCTGSLTEPCRGASSNTKNSADVTAFAQPEEILRVSLGSPTAPEFSCPGYIATTDVLDFDLTTLDGDETTAGKTVVFTLNKPFVTRAASKYDVCWQAPMTFATKSGVVSPPDPANAGFFVGLLPTCNPKTRTEPPCVATRVKDRAGNIVITVRAPGGDPRAKF
jgi:hypothetical protein